MFDELLRRVKDRLLEPVARWLGPVNPNLISWLALVTGLGCAWASGTRHLRWALLLWVVNRFLDGLDGAVARVHGRKTDYGGYLDLTLDYVIYAAIPIGLVAGAPSTERWWALALLLGSFCVNAPSWMVLAAILERRGTREDGTAPLTTITMPPALIAGTETVVFFSLFLLFPEYLVPLYVLMALLVLVNVPQRLLWARRHLGSS